MPSLSSDQPTQAGEQWLSERDSRPLPIQLSTTARGIEQVKKLGTRQRFDQIKQLIQLGHVARVDSFGTSPGLNHLEHLAGLVQPQGFDHFVQFRAVNEFPEDLQFIPATDSQTTSPTKG